MPDRPSLEQVKCGCVLRNGILRCRLEAWSAAYLSKNLMSIAPDATKELKPICKKSCAMTDRPTLEQVQARSAKNREAWDKGDRHVSKAARKPQESTPGATAGRKTGRDTPPKPTEHQDQVAVVTWFDAWGPTKGLDPRLLFAVPNAGAGSQRGQSGKLKAEGLRAGWPDLGLALPQRGDLFVFAGMFIELKRVGWTPPKSGKALAHWQNQQDIHAMLRRNNYSCVVAIGYDEAVRAITEYCERALRHSTIDVSPLLYSPIERT